MLNIEIYGKTDVGKKRTNNEDAFIIQKIWGNDYVLAVVIDGIGGYEGGEIATGIAQNTIIEYLQSFSNGERLSLLVQAVTQANNAIFEERKQKEEYNRMGCVLTACLFDISNGQVHMAHVGDTRFYCYRNTALSKLSHDHSSVGYHEDMGILSEEEALAHPQRNIVDRSLGSEPHDVNDTDFVEAKTFPIHSQSIYVLCSDGLSDMLTSTEITSVLLRKKNIEEKTENLIDLANQKGGKDNITVVLLETSEPTHEKCSNEKIFDSVLTDDKIEAPRTRKPKKRLVWFLVCLVLGFIGGWCTNSLYNCRKGKVEKDIIYLDLLNTHSIDSMEFQNDKDTLTIIDN